MKKMKKMRAEIFLKKISNFQKILILPYCIFLSRIKKKFWTNIFKILLVLPRLNMCRILGKFKSRKFGLRRKICIKIKGKVEKSKKMKKIILDKIWKKN